jgi:hypothetical protein
MKTNWWIRTERGKTATYASFKRMKTPYCQASGSLLFACPHDSKRNGQKDRYHYDNDQKFYKSKALFNH